MADETIILDFKIEQGDALTELERTKKSILQLKDEQKELNDEYKRGTKNIDDYTKETVQLEAALKKQSAQYSDIQKKVTGLKSPFDKLNESVKEQAKSVTVAGVSLQAFLNPATATLAIVGALGKAYASSTIGAKDLEFAHNQLTTATGLLTNQFAALFSSAEDGEGFVTKLFNSILESAGPAGLALAGASKGVALANEKLQDLQREEVKIRGENSDRLENNAELISEIDRGQKSINEKAYLYDQVINNLKTNQSEIVRIKQAELDRVTDIFKADSANEAKERAVLEAQKDLNRESARAERLIQAQIRAKDNLYDAEAKSLKAQRDKNAELDKENELLHYQGLMNKQLQPDSQKDIFDKEDLIKTKTIQSATDAFAVTQKIFEKKKQNNAEEIKSETDKTKIAKLEASNRLATISSYLGQAQALFAEDSAAYKIMGIGRATVDTYRAADLALATYPPPFGEIAAGVAIATGLANVAKILDVGFSQGGYTGSGGKHEVAGTVHKGEVVWSQADVALAGGASRVNSMRPTYSDGGITADYMSRQSSAQGMQNQAVQVTLVYEEFKRFTQGITFKEQATSR